MSVAAPPVPQNHCRMLINREADSIQPFPRPLIAENPEVCLTHGGTSSQQNC